MLKINLLPLEKRKPERTPLPRFFLIVADAAITAVIVVYVISILLQISSAKAANKNKSDELQSLSRDVAEYERVDKEVKTVEARAKEAEEVVYRPFRWAEVIDNVWDIINRNKVWIDKFEALDAKTAQSELKRIIPDAKTTAVSAIKLTCHAVGPYPNFMTKFRTDLKTDPKLSKVFNVININPDYMVEEEKDFKEGSSVSFNVLLMSVSTATTTTTGQAGAASSPPAVR